MRPHRWQPTRLPRPWDSPGKNTGVGCHFLLQCMKVKSESEAQVGVNQQRMCSCSSRRGKRCGSLTVSHSSVSNPPALKPSKQPPFLQQKPACLLALSLRTSTLYPQLACQRGRPCPSAFHIIHTHCSTFSVLGSCSCTWHSHQASGIALPLPLEMPHPRISLCPSQGRASVGPKCMSWAGHPAVLLTSWPGLKSCQLWAIRNRGEDGEVSG